MPAETAYDKLIQFVFSKHYKGGIVEFEFEREELVVAGEQLKLPRPKNIGDIVYTYRYRRLLPTAIQETAPKGKHWLIRPAGSARYRFVLVPEVRLEPHANLVVTKVPDSTPAIISTYSLNDEQALLAVLRYNRLIDTFLRVTCFSLQSHLRTSVAGIGQIEVDELYLGIDRRGAQYVIPVQAKGGKDRLSVIQVEQDIAFCRSRFGDLICRPVGAQFMPEGVIALIELASDDGQVVTVNEAHYRLVPKGEISTDDLRRYRERAED